MAKATADMQEYIDFEIMENHIWSRDKKFCFYRFFPPNLSILTPKEKTVEIETLCNFLENIHMPVQIFAMDKVEDLSKNKNFFANRTLTEYTAYTAQIINQISSYEVSDDRTNSIQRAYYFVIEAKNKDNQIIFEEALRVHRLKSLPVQKEELITIFRNFFIREFSSFDLYVFDKEVLQKYDRDTTGNTEKSNEENGQ